MSDDMLFVRMPALMEFGLPDLPRRPVAAVWLSPTRCGGVIPSRSERVMGVDPTPAHILAMMADGWQRSFGRRGWARGDGGFIADRRVDSGRYDDRLPTNRKRKRERCKAARRARMTR